MALPSRARDQWRGALRLLSGHVDGEPPAGWQDKGSGFRHEAVTSV